MFSQVQSDSRQKVSDSLSGDVAMQQAVDEGVCAERSSEPAFLQLTI